MLIILKKKVGTNQWGYPLTPTLFTKQFINPENSGELIAFNASGKTLEELTALAGYPIAKYINPIIEPDIFTTANESVKINGNPTVGFQSVYFGVAGDSANMSFDIVDGNGALQTQLDSTALGYPPILALPVLKVVNGNDASIVDEVYFSTTLIAGVITVTGSFPASGNWKLLTARVNAALSEIGATWILSKANATFRINS